MLLPYQHLACGGEIACCECVEIETACHRFTHRISAIPIRRTAPIVIDTRGLMSQRQSPDDCATHIIDIENVRVAPGRLLLEKKKSAVCEVLGVIR